MADAGFRFLAQQDQDSQAVRVAQFLEDSSHLLAAVHVTSSSDAPDLIQHSEYKIALSGPPSSAEGHRLTMTQVDENRSLLYNLGVHPSEESARA